jgi:hypothetical protein
MNPPVTRDLVGSRFPETLHDVDAGSGLLRGWGLYSQQSENLPGFDMSLDGRRGLGLGSDILKHRAIPVLGDLCGRAFHRRLWGLVHPRSDGVPGLVQSELEVGDWVDLSPEDLEGPEGIGWSGEVQILDGHHGERWLGEFERGDRKWDGTDLGGMRGLDFQAESLWPEQRYVAELCGQAQIEDMLDDLPGLPLESLTGFGTHVRLGGLESEPLEMENRGAEMLDMEFSGPKLLGGFSGGQRDENGRGHDHHPGRPCRHVLEKRSEWLDLGDGNPGNRHHWPRRDAKPVQCPCLVCCHSDLPNQMLIPSPQDS